MPTATKNSDEGFTMRLYHTSLGIPDSIKLPQGRISLQYGYHAEQAMATDPCRKLADLVPAFLYASEARIVEVEATDDGVAIKFLFRLRLTSERDLCLVICPDGFVKTLWTNRRKDTHATLDKSRYVLPERVLGASPLSLT